MTFSETTGRGFIILGGVVLAGIILACPHPAPTPVGPPDASDAAPAPAPVGCGPACLHAVQACPTVDQPTCAAICPREPSSYAQALMAATGCPGVKAADPGAPATQSGPANPHGR